MPISISNKPQVTGIVILSIGVTLLAFTFINAFFFLQEPFSILASGDLGRVFGEALAPLIQACIRLMYLGIMGWIGSMLTVRGIPLVTHRHTPVAPALSAQPQLQPQVAQQSKTVTPALEQPKQTLPPRVEVPQQPLKAPQVQQTPATPPQQAEPRAILIPPENQKEE